MENQSVVERQSVRLLSSEYDFKEIIRLDSILTSSISCISTDIFNYKTTNYQFKVSLEKMYSEIMNSFYGTSICVFSQCMEKCMIRQKVKANIKNEIKEVKIQNILTFT